MPRWITEKVLRATPAGGGSVSTAGLAQATGLTRREVVLCVQQLNKRGLVNMVRKGVYRLSASGEAAKAAGLRITSGVAGERNGVQVWTGTFRERLWRALRQQVKATVPELVELAGTGREKRPETNARKYLWALAGAGYVVKMRRREPGDAISSPGFVRYFLARDTGPRPPIYRERRRSVFDANTGDEFALPESAPHGAAP